MDTPVAFIIFNRPGTTALVFNEIRRARPPVLLVVADGPRPGVGKDMDGCAAARSIIERVDWECEVRTNYSDANLGCRMRVSSGIDWVFDQVEEAIILEDDCLPDSSFFPFCEALLERYRLDERISHIGGVNFQFGRARTGYSYYFSRYTHIWGWATWKRAWKGYDVDMRLWPQVREGRWLYDALGDRNVARHWARIFDRVYRGKVDTWDYQWQFHSLMNGRSAVVPCANLVSNIGFNLDSTHTVGTSRYSNMRTEPMDFPLRHPPFIIRDARADSRTDVRHFLFLPFPLSVAQQAKQWIDDFRENCS